MALFITIACLLVLVLAKPKDEEDVCERIKCKGIEYECFDGQCYCADGYIPNHFQTRCVKCPGKGERCFGACCNYYGNATLTCWQGICRACHDNEGNFVCRDSLDQVFLISTTQIAMGMALVVGIVATFVLLYKLCAAATLRPMGTSSNYEGRLSIGSLQLYIEERLRDAPPRYSRTPPTGVTAAVIPATVYLNSGFIHDCSVPPPAYTPRREGHAKDEANPQPTVHI